MADPDALRLTDFESCRPTILVVDDALINLTLLSKGLAADYRVVTAASGLQGLALAETEHPDVILLDVMMPGMDGYAVARQLSLIPELARIPILFLTAQSDQDSQLRGLELGAVDFLTKPFSLKILRKRIANVIERDRLRTTALQYQTVLNNLLIQQTGAKNTLESVFNASSDALIVTDRAFWISRVNSNAEQLLHSAPDELIGSNFLRFHFKHINGDALPVDAISANTGRLEGRLCLPGHTDQFVTIICRPFVTNEEESGYLFSLQDISSRKKVEQELALARERELAVGATIQQSLLFGKPPTNLEGISIACFTEASNGVDGDFYTFTEINPACFEVLTGDVMGKGVTAALIAAGVKNTYYKTFTSRMSKCLGKATPTPAEIINAVHAIITPELIRIESFVTLSLVRVDRREKTVTWVNAGHTPTLLVRSDGQEVLELLGDNLPLGVVAGEVFVEHVTPIDVGDALLLYSDGISEATDADKNEYGLNRIKTILRMGQAPHSHPSVTLNSLRSDLSNHTRHLGPSDDSTAIFIRVNPLRQGARGTVLDRLAPEYFELPRRLDQLGLIRDKIARVAQDQSDTFVHMLQLAAFEAATNIVRHAPEHLVNAPLTVAVTRTALAISVELIYEGTPFAPAGAPSPDFSGNSEGGFGLFIINSAVDQVDYGSPMPDLASIRLVKALEQRPKR